MAYTTIANFKTWANWTGNDEDTLLTTLLGIAEDLVDDYTGTIFEVSAASNKTYSRMPGLPDHMNKFSDDGRILYFHDWLATATGVTITDSPTVTYLPEDGAPYWGCIKTDGSWAYPTVTVNGKWGYSETAPTPIIVAVWMLMKWLYDRRDSQQGEAVVITPEGRVILAEGLPSDVCLILDKYKDMVIA